VATVRQVSCSAPTPAAATVPQQGAFLAPSSLAVCSHKEAVDYLTLLTQGIISVLVRKGSDLKNGGWRNSLLEIWWKRLGILHVAVLKV